MVSNCPFKSQCCYAVFKYSGLDLTADKSRIHKEATGNRIQQDENAVANVIKIIEERIINPFSVSGESTPEDPQPLSSISTGMVAADEISKWVRFIEDQGKKQLREFVKKRIHLQEVDIFDHITKNKVSNFSFLRNKAKVKKDGNVTTLDIDRKIFSKLIVVSQTRDFDLQKLLEFELSSVPLALFNPDGSMRKYTKSELLKEIESGLAVEEIDIVPGSSAVIIDFMVLVRMVCTDTSKCKTIGELSENLLSIIFGMYTVASHIDVVCDRYDVSDSIKAAERARRETVDMQEIAIHNENTPLPKQRIKMLSNSRNKANIVEFLYRHWIDKGRDKLTASQKLILAGGFKDGREAMILIKQSASLVPELYSDHKEAHSRMFGHVEHAKQADSASRIIIWSIDTDVAVICPRIVKALNIEELYFLTGTKQRKWTFPCI